MGLILACCKAEAVLDAEESETHVPDLPKAQIRFLFHEMNGFAAAKILKPGRKRAKTIKIASLL
jgi:hypothetical protein